METTGCGCAFFDYDNDGWLDIFLVNGTRFEADWKAVRRPSAACTRTIATARLPTSPCKAGIGRTGWGQGCCVGDYNNDGHDDLFVSLLGRLRTVAQ